MVSARISRGEKCPLLDCNLCRSVVESGSGLEQVEKTYCRERGAGLALVTLFKRRIR